MPTERDPLETYPIAVDDLPYVKHGDTEYMARVRRPVGRRPFPAGLEALGGSWCLGDRTANAPMVDNIARRGVVVVSIDFRSPPQAGYPASVADFNFAVRWLKSKAAEFHSRPEMVGAMGSSSGGHLAILNSMK